MNIGFLPILTAVGLFLGMLFLQEVGRRMGARRLARDPEGALAGLGVIEGAVFGIIGLFMAFTFSGAAARLDTRRAQIAEEANAIGTAWLRLDLLPAGAQPELREKFRQYVDARQAAYRKLPDIAAARAELARAKALQDEIWTKSVSACHNAEAAPDATKLLLPALNHMIDFSTTRDTTVQLHPPAIVYVMLAVLVLAGSMLAGFAMAASKTRRWLHILAFVAIMGVTVYVILDLEFPRLGLIRIDSFDQVMVNLRESMK